MTTRDNYYLPAPYHQALGRITAKPYRSDRDGTLHAVVDLGDGLSHPRAGSLWISDAAIARELIAAGQKALEILGEVTE